MTPQTPTYPVRDEAEVRILAEQIFDTDRTDDWLASPNPHFRGLTPKELIQAGETTRLLSYLREILSPNAAPSSSSR